MVAQICEQLEKDMELLKQAALETYAAATGEESKPENEYDTRALEASYLAGAQAKRVLDIESQLTVYKFFALRDFTEEMPIGPSAVVGLDLDGKASKIFLVPTSGGLTIEFEKQQIQVLSAKSPLGEALQGLRLGDFAMVDRADRTLEYEIISVE